MTDSPMTYWRETWSSWIAGCESGIGIGSQEYYAWVGLEVAGWIGRLGSVLGWHRLEVCATGAPSNDEGARSSAFARRVA
jgi:hypothetical protein